jgi:DNA-binding MarR family transcriptional regulator
MNAAELYMLGRKLMKIADSALPMPDGNRPPTTLRMVVLDVAENPGSSIGEITDRTGFPQSLVSMSVKRLRKYGVLETYADPEDGRRTLVRAVEEFVAARAGQTMPSITEPLAEAIGPATTEELEQIDSALELLAQKLIPHMSDRHRQQQHPQETK